MEKSLGMRVAEARKRQGLSQKEFAALVERSESWVSQVERDVMPVERISLLQKLAEVLGLSVADLRPETVPEPTYPTPVHSDLEDLRSALTGPPALDAVFGASSDPIDIDALAGEADNAWSQALQTNFAPLAVVIPRLESALRGIQADYRAQILQLLARSYQAASAGFARQNEGDAAWIAGDRALIFAEASGDPLQVVAGMFRLAHTFMRLHRFDQAQQLADQAISVLQPRLANGEPETLSMYGAMQLITAALAGFNNDRPRARAALDEAERVATAVGEGRNDYDTEFGPTNVKIHRVSIAVDLADAGEAIDVARSIDSSQLSNERQMRLHLDTARAYIQRRQPDKAVDELLAAETLAPENLRSHVLAHQTIDELLQQQRHQASSQLTNLAQRVGIRA